MGPFFLPMIISFVAGALGYVIFRFSIRPVYRYGQLRREVRREMKTIAVGLGKHQSGDSVRHTGIRLDKKRLNGISVRLSSLYQEDLPAWYRIMITGRGEVPLEAAKQLMSLANTRDSDHVLKKMLQIEKSLKLQ